MKSLRELLIVGPGPSSSHTIAPSRIAKSFLNECKDLDIISFEVTLYGSLALTGKGHGTDNIIKEVFKDYKCEVKFVLSLEGLSHPNTMVCTCFTKDKTISKRYNSIGGGAFIEEGKKASCPDVYPFTSFDVMKDYLNSNNITDLYEIIEMVEGKDIFDFGKKLLELSFNTIEKSLNIEDTLPGPLKLKSVAHQIYNDALNSQDEGQKRILLISSYAYATSEANARGLDIVTSPTCGASGVVPSLLYYEYKNQNKDFSKLVKAYLVGALICNFIKENASVSGALMGCQAEIGSACVFGATSLAYLDDLKIYQIEYSAEVAMEHFLGLTCDPVDGYVQIPCIERNAMAAIHAYTSYLYGKNISKFRKNRVSFDNVIKAMKETGYELPSDLKETSLGGLAKVLC